ncbi:TonB C-terminal domain-containing protein [Achromobacter sp. Marseille-Q0513]|uniref:TonB C-terminal domain-containing protein n=1 Tax=Achromobacter sp. Marseille-Q0513 TaxID=2829161 RepID=UPI001B904809|nr:TonB C-terminal domain-containing protein [Achromobacter sp. Marseille-Q0513]MBR8653496.1 TonB C-terminal domain-containing protein [Achromobacter sp. Marseille-Q0513]
MCPDTPALAKDAGEQTSAAAQADRLAGERHAYALPAQPLGDSLEAIGHVAGVAVLVEERHARRPAPALSGRYTVLEALRLLLDGSGLRIRKTDGEAIVVYEPAASATPAAPVAAVLAAGDIPGARSGAADFSAYIGRVQKALLRSLCGNAAARPGAYRLALQLRVDDSGQVSRLRLLDTTGSARVDAAVTRVVQGMDVGAPPPMGMPQPVSVLLLPGGANCPAARRPAG